VEKYKTLLDKELAAAVNVLEAPKVLKESITYSLTAKGKRIRPILLFATIDAFNEKPELGMKTACALEMIHTYSLIHDDLPSMDDDDLRRGIPTNHKVFGEGFAILAGDGLLTYSFQLIAEDSNLTDKQKLWLIAQLAKSAGPEGMVAGQVADIQAENKALQLADLEYIHHHKTGKLLTFSVLAGALIGGASDEQLQSLERFSQHIGLAFQIRDDILDVIGDQNVIGKPIGSDDGKLKCTYPALLTLDGAKDHLHKQITEAKTILQQLNLNSGLLLYLTDLIAGRNN